MLVVTLSSLGMHAFSVCILYFYLRLPVGFHSTSSLPVVHPQTRHTFHSLSSADCCGLRLFLATPFAICRSVINLSRRFFPATESQNHNNT